MHCQFSPFEAAALYAQLFAPHKRTHSVLTAGTRIAALLGGDPLVLLDQAAARRT